MALRFESWKPQAEALRLGTSARVEHDCGPGRVLKVAKTTEGLRAYCFRCVDSGWCPPDALPLADRLAAIKQQGLADERAKLAVLPEPRVPWAEWPAPHRLWLLKAGLGAHDAGRLGVYYHPPTGRVVLPVLGPSGPVFWQARAVNGRLPKYLSPEAPAAGVLPTYGKGEVIVLTEDILSAYKVSTAAPVQGWAMMGTSLKPHITQAVMKQGKPVAIWLDPDGAGKLGAAKAQRELKAVGVECRIVSSTKDPKLLHRATIRELLCIPSSR